VLVYSGCTSQAKKISRLRGNDVLSQELNISKSSSPPDTFVNNQRNHNGLQRNDNSRPMGLWVARGFGLIIIGVVFYVKYKNKKKKDREER